MPAPFDALAVANEILSFSEEKGLAITHMQLQKLAYFANGWHLALGGKPMIRQRFEAWKFGPVCDSIYHAFKENGSAPIGDLAAVVDWDAEGEPVINPRLPKVDPDSDFARRLIHRIVEKYGVLSGAQLSKLTHAENGAWWKAWVTHDGQNREGTDLLDEDIREEFDSYRRKPSTEAA